VKHDVRVVERRADAGERELDDVTLARAQRGEEAACRALVERYQRPLFALLGRLVGRERAGDLAQETFLRVFRALPRFDRGGAARLSSWILTIATRLSLDELRRRPPPEAALDETLAAPSRADETAERRALGAALARAVASLSAEQRAVILLREVHELEYEEIARALDVDLGTVKSRLSRARAALRAALGEQHEG
jgi:RNA polymerase sigma-70 factor (ECF subfamily)